MASQCGDTYVEKWFGCFFSSEQKIPEINFSFSKWFAANIDLAVIPLVSLLPYYTRAVAKKVRLKFIKEDNALYRLQTH